MNRLVSDISIVPLPSEQYGEVPRAYIVRSAQAHDLDDDEVRNELHALVKGKFPSYKRLAGGIAFLPELPRTASGKVRRDLVKQMARDHHESLKKARELESLRISAQIFTYESDESEAE